LGDRIDRYAGWSGSIGENIDFGNMTAEDIVMSMIIDDGVSSKGHRHNIFNESEIDIVIYMRWGYPVKRYIIIFT